MKNPVDHCALKPFTAVGRVPALVWLAVPVVAALWLAGCARDNPRKHLERAERYFQAQQYDKAEIEYQSVLRLEGENPRAIQRLGAIYQEQADFRKALVFLRKSASLDTNNLDVRLRLGLTYLSISDSKGAREEAALVLAKQPANDEALILLADAAAKPKDVEDTLVRLEKLRAQAEHRAGFHLALGSLYGKQRNQPAAAAAFARALVLDPKSAPAHLAAANLCLSTNNLKDAEQHFKTAAEVSPVRSYRRLRYAEFKILTGDLDGARQQLKQTTQAAPDYIPAWVKLGTMALMEKKFEDCGNCVSRVVARDPLHYEALLLGARLKLARSEVTNAIADMERMNKQYSAVPQLQYELATAHLLNHDLSKAIHCLNQAVTLDPDYTAAILLLAEMNIYNGDVATAATALNALIKKYPFLFQAYTSLAKAYEGQRKFDQAQIVCQAMAKQFPKNPRAHFHLATVLRDMKKPAEARAAFEQARALAPDDPVVVEQIMELDLAEKRFDAAARLVQDTLTRNTNSAPLRVLLAGVQLARGDTNQALATLEQTIALQPGAMGAYYMLSQIYVATGQQAQALDKLRAALAKNPRELPAHMLSALIHERAENFKAARDAYEKALSIDPTYTIALNNLVYLYAEYLGQTDKAYELANKSREFFLSEPLATDTFAWVLFRRGEHARAAGLLREVAAKRPGHPDILFHLGMAQYMVGEEDAARQAFQQALATGKRFFQREEAERRLAFLNADATAASPAVIAALEQRLAIEPGDPVVLGRLGAIYERSGAFDKAAQTYEKALKANPKAVLAQLKLAQLNADRLGNNAKALELAKAARDLAPDDPRIAYLLGKLASRAGDTKWALSLLQESERQSPRDADVLCDFALALYANGRVTEAESAMNRALAANANFQRADEAKRFLALASLYAAPDKARQQTALITETLKSDSNSIPALMATGVLHEQAQNFSAAKLAYERILAVSPQFAPAVRQLTFLYAASPTEEKRAYELGLRAREAFPRDADVGRTLGILSYRRGEYQHAVPLLTEVSRNRPTDAEVFYYLGLAHHRLKAKSEAGVALRKALSLNLAAPLAQEANKVLQTLK
ncbi:MAG: tetratricopeptide repeat protein [Verrucomicrobia bacterium]|nr:tetratricopeptide repeat protein [Verrucomicrobiota bacterium]